MNAHEICELKAGDLIRCEADYYLIVGIVPASNDEVVRCFPLTQQLKVNVPGFWPVSWGSTWGKWPRWTLAERVA